MSRKGSVQTRIERIKELMKKGLWKEETGVIGLPKTKIVRIKAKKKVKAEEDAAAPAAAADAAPQSRQKRRKPLPKLPRPKRSWACRRLLKNDKTHHSLLIGIPDIRVHGARICR